MKKLSSIVCLGIAMFAVSILGTTNQVSADEVTQISSVSFDDENTIIGPLMTYDEMIEEIAETNGISVEQAQSEMVGSNPNNLRAARAKQYRTLSQQFTVNSKYKPTMRFYCETTESGGFRAIKKIERVEMIRGYKGLSKQFGGSVYVNLEDPNIIFYIVNGDFYNNGSTTYEAGVNIGLGKNASVGFKASSTSSHYQYRYVESRLRF